MTLCQGKRHFYLTRSCCCFGGQHINSEHAWTFRSSSPEILKLFLAKENTVQTSPSQKPLMQDRSNRDAPAGGSEGGGGSEDSGAQLRHTLSLQTNSLEVQVRSRGQGHPSESGSEFPIQFSPYQGATLHFLNKGLGCPKSPCSWHMGLWWQSSDCNLITHMSFFPLYSKPKVNTLNLYRDQISHDYCDTMGRDNRKKDKQNVLPAKQIDQLVYNSCI